ncbi:unnamed protein product, partial [Scytosiphon promiscuus]
VRLHVLHARQTRALRVFSATTQAFVVLGVFAAKLAVFPPVFLFDLIFRRQCVVYACADTSAKHTRPVISVVALRALGRVTADRPRILSSVACASKCFVYSSLRREDCARSG